MNKIINDYITENKLTKDELNHLNLLKENSSDDENTLELLKFFSHRNQFAIANKIFENSNCSVKNNPSFFYPIALIKMS